MKQRIIGLLIVVGLFLAVPIANADPTLNEFGFMWNGTFYNGADPLPANFNTAGFNTSTGLGTLVVSFGPGAQLFNAVFDHDIGPQWDKDLAGRGGTLAVGQSYEMGNPDSSLSPLVPNFFAEALNNHIDPPGLGEHDDWAMGMGFAFSVNPGQTATLALVFGTSEPVSGFWLHQVGGSGDHVYMQGLFRGPDDEIPEPSTMLLAGGGAFLLWLKRRK